MFIGHKKTFALEYQGKVIGSLGIEQYNEDHFPEFADKKCREIGYVLSKEYWGQGLMPEAVKEVIRYKSLGGSHSAREDTEVSAGNVPVAERERKTERTSLPGAEPAVPEEFFCKCFPLWGLCRPLVFGRL